MINLLLIGLMVRRRVFVCVLFLVLTATAWKDRAAACLLSLPATWATWQCVCSYKLTAVCHLALSP